MATSKQSLKWSNKAGLALKIAQQLQAVESAIENAKRH